MLWFCRIWRFPEPRMFCFFCLRAPLLNLSPKTAKLTDTNCLEVPHEPLCYGIAGSGARTWAMQAPRQRGGFLVQRSPRLGIFPCSAYGSPKAYRPGGCAGDVRRQQMQSLRQKLDLPAPLWYIGNVPRTDAQLFPGSFAADRGHYAEKH